MSATTNGITCRPPSVCRLTCGLVSFALLLLSVPSEPLRAQTGDAAPLVLVGNRDYPPLSYLENGLARGFDVDVARAVATKIGREVRIELMDWATARQRVLDGSASGLLNLGVS